MDIGPGQKYRYHTGEYERRTGEIQKYKIKGKSFVTEEMCP